MHYELIRSRRKTMSLEITKDCRLVVRAPLRAKQEEIDAFVAKHEAWAQKHLSTMPPPLPEPTAEEIAALKRRAAELLPGKVAHWSAVMDVKPTGWKITTARKRYGSCSGKNGREGDLDQFRQRIQQTSADGYCRTQLNRKIREFLPGFFLRGPYRSTGF